MTDTGKNKTKIKKYSKGQTGSFCLEIALIFPILMGILFAFLWQMAAIRSEMVFQCVLLKEAEKASFWGVLCEYIPDAGDEEAKAQETDGGFADEWIGEAFAAAIKIQIKNHYEIIRTENPTFRSLIFDHDEFIESPAGEDEIYLTSVYSIYTPFQKLDRKFTVALRLWDRGDGTGKVVVQTDENIWEYDNFTRGKILRTRFGGNLPLGFPVLSGFRDGNALIIKSMNLRSASWQNPADAAEQMKEFVDELSRYQGMEAPWGKEGILIRRAEIINRNILFIIPENTDMERFSALLREVEAYAALSDVAAEIIPYQKA